MSLSARRAQIPVIVGLREASEEQTGKGQCHYAGLEVHFTICDGASI